MPDHITKATLTENNAKCGLELRFPFRPAPDVLRQLKESGWKWSSFNQCWWIRRNPNALFLAKRVVAAHAEELTPDAEMPASGSWQGTRASEGDFQPPC
jgi:hypothetical protein